MIANFRFVIILVLIFQLSKAFDIKKNSCKKYNDYPSWYWNKNCYFNPDVLSDVPTMIRRNGYQVEGYPITTDDGYVLMIFRILARNHHMNYQPIYLLNGILTSAAVWVSIKDRSLAFKLADQGYDVWLGSVRGSHYSKLHKNYNVSDQGYWNFSLDDLAKIDLSTQLNFIGNKTGKSGSIIYIGHSMGSTLSFMYASDNVKEANSLLAGIIALAPAVYFSNSTLINDVLDIASDIKNVLDHHNINGLFYQDSLNKLIVYFCTLSPFTCKPLLNKMFGKLDRHILPDDFLLLLSYFPDGVSLRMLLQYEYFQRYHRFTKFNYGTEKNKFLYGRMEPPLYDLGKIKLPVYLFYGKNDPLISEQNVTRIFHELGSSMKKMQVIPKDNTKWSYNHLDFILAKDLKELFYPELFKVLKQLSKD